MDTASIEKVQEIGAGNLSGSFNAGQSGMVVQGDQS
jgi:hypothetical protein